MTFDRDTFAAELSRTVADRLDEADVGIHAPGVQQLIVDYLHRSAGYVRPRVLYAAAEAYHGTTEADNRRAGAAGASGASGTSLRRLAVATEILHVFALLHDDRIDNQPEDTGQRGAADRVLAGDALYAIGFGLLSETVISAGLPGRIVEIVRKAAVTTVVGQAADITFADGQPDIGNLFDLYDMKTGRYTFVAPLQIGALWAGCPPEDVGRLSAVGIPFGRAYQLRDDLIDLEKLVHPTHRGRHTYSVREDTSVRSSDAAPPWEWNLATAWAHSGSQSTTAFTADSSPDEAVSSASTYSTEISRFVAETVPHLLREADSAATRLTLPVPRRRRLMTDLQGIFGHLPVNRGAQERSAW